MLVGVRFGGIRLSTVAAAALIGVAGCGSSGVDTEPPPTSAPASSRLLGPGEFAEAVADPVRTTINVHVPFEGALPGTDVIIPFDQIERQASELPSDRTTPIAVYCLSGRMSAEAVQTLENLGYTDIADLKGGMRAWQASGRALAQPSADR
ncbi:rhodanese-like domain-containing protein [Prauserella muralis]|uniref:Sulfurtransferase n=1 Tax=Prauserella muralis TaxID=588067 RepID=A0A2V4AVC0_9PSEU|nr:rhodanese-like domain-containing protein [Prauserella muralis]PXY25400.1 sulfurtransferase [Prauserella muralis]TWE27515.1 rhodanese-like domain-containing protein [Prauserella muralis]